MPGLNALQLLKSDHAKVKDLLSKLDRTTERGVKTREGLFARFRSEMSIHEQIEEEIFYPELKEHAKSKDIALEGYEEHHVVDMVMSELSDLPYDDETWGAKFTVMKENIEHHVTEEEGEMFKRARQVLSRRQLDELGERMAERKAELRRAKKRNVKES